MCNIQDFSNTFSLVKLTFFFKFFVKGVKPSVKFFTFCWFWLGKMHQNGLSGMYIGFQVCWIQWHWFGISTIGGFQKNPHLRRKVHVKWGKNNQNGMGPMQQCYLGSYFTPTVHFRTLCLNLALKSIFKVKLTS